MSNRSQRANLRQRCFFITTLLILLGNALTMSTSAQTRLSPRYGIAWTDAGGFTEKGDNWIAKRRAKQARKYDEQIAARFEQNMRELRAFDDWLDTIWREDLDEFAECFDVSRVSPSMIHVSIEAEPFAVEGYPVDFRASGVAYYDGRIKIVYWNVRADIGGQAAIDLARGELRNWLWWRLTGKPREMWGQRACQ